MKVSDREIIDFFRRRKKMEGRGGEARLGRGFSVSETEREGQ